MEKIKVFLPFVYILGLQASPRSIINSFNMSCIKLFLIMYKIVIKSEDYAIPYNLEMMLHTPLPPISPTKAYWNKLGWRIADNK